MNKMKKDKSIKSTKQDDEAKKSSKQSRKNSPVDDSEVEIKNDESMLAKNATLPEKDSQEITNTQNEITNEAEESFIIYREPELTSIIIENYEGDKHKGFFQGLGRALYKNGCVYEGEFNSGMMHGKGKYVWPTGAVYDGDFLNNEITGNGTYKWFTEVDGIQILVSTYEGEVLKGKRHGFGTFTCENHTYIGEWYMGKRHGKGKILYDTQGMSYYEGDWINDKKYGCGIRRYKSGNLYEGMWINDIRHGTGTMRWIDKNQLYTGQWENGIQNGIGEHHWYLPRVEKSQYALRNSYYGSFVNGKRHGNGTFMYANGAKYEGEWKNNLKHGHGKFIFKNGKFYDGYFEDDKMIEPASYNRQSNFLKDIQRVKTRIPSAGITLDKNFKNEDDGEIFNFELEIPSLIESLPENQRENEHVQAMKIVTRYIDKLTDIYRFYSKLGVYISPDNTYLMNRMQFWRLLKDCKVDASTLSLMDIDRVLESYDHFPNEKILIRHFFNYMVIISYHLYKNHFSNKDIKIASCFEYMMNENINPFSFNIRGSLYVEKTKTLTALNYMDKCYEIYKMNCLKRKASDDETITMRNFINMLNEYKIIHPKRLATKDVIKILSQENEKVFDSDNSYNIELEMTFLEFFEVLIECACKYVSEATIKDPSTPRPSTIITREQSFLSEASVNTHADDKCKSGTHTKANIDLSKIISEPEESMMEQKNGQKSKQPIDKEALKKQDSNIISETSNKKESVKITTNEANIINETDKETFLWQQKLDLFFNTKLFKAADHLKKLKQLTNQL